MQQLFLRELLRLFFVLNNAHFGNWHENTSVRVVKFSSGAKNVPLMNLFYKYTVVRINRGKTEGEPQEEDES